MCIRDRIITASKHEQRITESPSAISIITEEDIKRSGAQSIPDILKFFPGLDVIEITSSHWEVNARGFNQLLSNKMLVLVDGRSVYFDYFGGVIWQGLPIQLEDIKRIEIVRGPISALYGANAFSGVINIITKSPRELIGKHFYATLGNLATGKTSFIYGGKSGKLAYKVSAALRNCNSWRNSHLNSEKVGLGNFKIEYIFSGKSIFSIDGGLGTGNIEQIVLSDFLKFDATTSYLKANYNYSNFSLQAFWNKGHVKAPSIVNYGKNTNIEYNTIDIETQHLFDFGSPNSIIFGGSLRYNTISSSIIDKDHTQTLIAGYMQNSLELTPELTALVGIRVDKHPLVKVKWSPRMSFIFNPMRNHTFRLDASQAFRNPTFTDSYIKVPFRPQPLPSPPFPEGLSTNLTVVGNDKLNSEKIETYELGYQTYFLDKAKFKIDFFHNKVSGFITRGDFQPVSFFKDPITGEYIYDPFTGCLLYTSPSPRDLSTSRMPSSA